MPYSKAVCETSWISLDDREEIAEDSPDSGSVAQHIDNDTEWSDVVEHRCSGVADILVTGEVRIACLSHPITHPSPFSLNTKRSVQTTEHHGNAWGQYSYIGRVRPWDGLIVLLRTPVCIHHRLRALFSVNFMIRLAYGFFLHPTPL